MCLPKAAANDAQQVFSRRRFVSGAAMMTGGLLLTNHLERPSMAQAETEAVNPLYYQSATRIATMIRERHISSTEVVRAFLDRIATVDPRIHAVLYLAAETAMNRAKEADKALAKGDVWGPLHGVPVSIKDNLNTAGMPTTCGVPLWREDVPAEDATVVRKVKEAGAIILAKTNLPFCGDAYESHNLFCKTNNPYDLERTPGGSSGGEAALIAAGGSPLGIGADMGGSIRVPSHFCGTAGLRPAHGRVSLAGFIPEFDSPGPAWYTSIGPMARYVEDLAVLFNILSGPDRQDPFAFSMPCGDYRRVTPKGLRIGWWTGDGHIEPSPETSDTVERAARALGQLGTTVTKMEAPYDLKRADDILVALFADAIINGTPKKLHRLGAEADKLMIEAVETIRESYGKLPPDQIEVLQNELGQLRRSVHASMDSYDAVLCPVTRNPAARHGTTWRGDANQEFCYCQLVGLVWTRPTGVVRCGTSPEGLPIGIQVVGAPYREDTVLGVLKYLEKELGGWQPPPL